LLLYLKPFFAESVRATDMEDGSAIDPIAGLVV